VDPSHSRADSGVLDGTLVVGATGILRPAALTLLAHGACVVAVGRDQARIDHLRADARGASTELAIVRHDATADGFVDAVGAALDERGWQLAQAILYAPATSADLVTRLVERFDPLVVEVLTSRAAEPPSAPHEWTIADLPHPRSPRHRRLVLGWTRVDGRPAWHTSDQISAAAMGALELPGDRVLGTVHPWSDRP
jgi:NAD(P)-dependent dehydrogenase (short-subunit alcohol dehydrogenase family)